MKERDQGLMKLLDESHVSCNVAVMFDDGNDAFFAWRTIFCWVEVMDA